MERPSAAAPMLGVGFPYLPDLPVELYRGDGLIDFVELAPEILCRQRRKGDRICFEIQPALLAQARATIGERPLVVHGVELSLGTVGGWNGASLELLDRLREIWPFSWHSEHLSFQVATDALGERVELGTPLPMPFTHEAIELLAPRLRALNERYGAPFLIENAVHYLPHLPADDGMDEIAFLNALVDRSRCSLLLDLFNLHCNALHHGFDAREALGRLRLDSVVELHLAGGSSRDGFLMDSHSERVPEPVWSLLEWTLANAPSVRGVVFEVLAEMAPALGIDNIRRELQRLRHAWQARPAQLVA